MPVTTVHFAGLKLHAGPGRSEPGTGKARFQEPLLLTDEEIAEVLAKLSA